MIDSERNDQLKVGIEPVATEDGVPVARAAEDVGRSRRLKHTTLKL